MNIRLRARRLSGHSRNCVINVLKNDREQLKRSKNPRVEPRSRWYDASFIDNLPMMRENMSGRRVAALFIRQFQIQR